MADVVKALRPDATSNRPVLAIDPQAVVEGPETHKPQFRRFERQRADANWIRETSRFGRGGVETIATR